MERRKSPSCCDNSSVVDALNKHSIKGPQLSLFNGYFSLPRFTIFKSSHSGSHLKRIWWPMQQFVMITISSLTLVCRYLTIYLEPRSCARSCIPSSQLPRSEYSAKVHRNPQNLRVLLPTVLLQSLPILLRSGITLDCKNHVLRQTRNCKKLPPRPPFLPCPRSPLNSSTR